MEINYAEERAAYKVLQTPNTTKGLPCSSFFIFSYTNKVERCSIENMVRVSDIFFLRELTKNITGVLFK